MFEDVAHPDNYYHSLGENLVAYFIKACLYLGHCNDTGVRLFLNHGPESYSRFPHVTEKFSTFLDWGERLPWFQPYLSYLTDEPVRHPTHPSFANQVGHGLCVYLTRTCIVESCFDLPHPAPRTMLVATLVVALQVGVMSEAVFGVGPNNRHYTYWLCAWFFYLFVPPIAASARTVQPLPSLR